MKLPDNLPLQPPQRTHPFPSPLNEISSTYVIPPHILPEIPPQPSLGCLRTAFGVNANRTHLDRGADTPFFPIFTKKVVIHQKDPLEPSLPGLRTEIESNAVRRDLDRGCGGRWG